MIVLGMMACFAQVKEEPSEPESVGDTAILSDTEQDEDSGAQTEDSAADLDPNFDLDITGSYSDILENEHVISDDFWIMQVPEDGEYLYHIRQIYNNDRFLIARNDNQNGETEAGLWSRFDWARDNQNNLWFCQTTYLAETEQAAFDTMAPNTNDLSFNGCEGFGWLQLY